MARILVVDDEPIFLRLLGQVLKRDGHEVEIAQTGAAAIQTGHRCRPHLLLTDWKLGNHITGLEVAAELSASNHELSIVMMTGYSAAELENEVRHIRNLRILQKPFGAEIILGVVREMDAKQRS